MTDFLEAKVVVQQLDDENWQLLEGFEYKGRDQTFEVPDGQRTDFASVPRPLVWFLPRYGRYTKAAILHDFLWREKAGTPEVSWRDADAMFRRAMRQLDVAFLRRWIMWAAVRCGSFFKPGGREGWWKDSWAVALAALIALPIIALPVIAILISLLTFFLVELIFWVPLKVAAKVRESFGKEEPRKEVNTPSLLLKL